MADVNYVILGRIFDDSGSANVTVQINGSTVSESTVTSDENPLAHDTILGELGRWTAASELTGNVSVQVTTDADEKFFTFIVLENTVGNTTYWNELEYPDPEIDNHAVSNVAFDGVSQPVPVNTEKPETPGDIRGWHYRFDGYSTMTCNYFTGPFNPPQEEDAPPADPV